ncbi:PREDICTED: uncharacterized protein C8orf48 homolog [Condylura cristata]|uniref:uncharacterized protein C8orf48 homolog n=1 Tax=Condylura cristata TaxID=143302 RepID=UPI000642C597|nr:PREDICTED: uncharacterized protein C8orf48 homolog [Condylura cristata]
MHCNDHLPRGSESLKNTESWVQMDISDTTDFSVNDTCTSFTDEVQNSSTFSSPGELHSWLHASGHKLENERPNICLEQEGKQSEVSDLNNYEKKLSRKWISCLKDKLAHSGQHHSDSRLQTEITGVSDEELNALQSFCINKINLMHHRVNSKKSRHKKLQLRLEKETPKIDVLNCIVPDDLLNRIYLKSLMTTLEQVATAKQHVISQCPDCSRKRAELAQCAFLKQKKTLLESLLLQEKIDEHLHTKDFLTLIGEAHQDLPRLSDDPGVIWRRLTEKSAIGYSNFKKPYSADEVGWK